MMFKPTHRAPAPWFKSITRPHDITLAFIIIVTTILNITPTLLNSPNPTPTYHCRIYQALALYPRVQTRAKNSVQALDGRYLSLLPRLVKLLPGSCSPVAAESYQTPKAAIYQALALYPRVQTRAKNSVQALLKITFGKPMTIPTQLDLYPDIAGCQYPYWIKSIHSRILSLSWLDFFLIF